MWHLHEDNGMRKEGPNANYQFSSKWLTFHVDFAGVWYSANENGLPNSSGFLFEVNIVKANRIRESMCNVSARLSLVCSYT
jgi:hypothetical protein